MIEAAESAGDTPAAPLSGFGATSITGATDAVSFRVRLVAETFAGDVTRFFNAVVTSADCVAGGFCVVVIAADFGCGTKVSVRTGSGAKPASTVFAAANCIAGVAKPLICDSVFAATALTAELLAATFVSLTFVCAFVSVFAD